MIIKRILFVLLLLLFFIPITRVNARVNDTFSFVNVVNPIRGDDFWEMGNQKPEDAVLGQMEILKQKQLSATWLLRYDALKNEQIQSVLMSAPASHEKGLFLEITPTLTNDAGVLYRTSQFWHFAESVLLTGYEVDERRKLIDTAFEKFNSLYGIYPKSVGAWWIDAGSLTYMEDKYGITAALIVADQYSTDNYQIWGQYWSTPYYPSKQNGLFPAQTAEQKIPVVMMQWAARDPVNGYGKGVEESTYSVQANDYIDYHNLDIGYFSKLIDIYTHQPQNSFGEIVIGLENSYDWKKYQGEYEKQIQTLVDKQKSGQFQIVTMSQFGNWYQEKFKGVSPQHSIIADDPLGSERKVVWFMNPYYRAGWFLNNQGSVFRDVRQYGGGEEEPCLIQSCKAVNFATFKTRSLDEVTFGDFLVVDPGRISEFKRVDLGGQLQFNYVTDAGRVRSISFLERDIKIDDQITSIDTFILRAKKQRELNEDQKISLENNQKAELFFGFASVAGQLGLFLAFLVLAIFIPGYVLVHAFKNASFSEQFFLSFGIGLTTFTLSAFLLGLIHSYWLLFGYIVFFGWLFLKKELFKNALQFKLKKQLSLHNFLLCLLIILGIIFQTVAVVRSGWVYSFGMGFWGPTGHDHIWHQALNNQVLQGGFPEMPIFSGNLLTNYHYFFNVLVAATSKISNIDVIHLLFRFYPVLFSALLGYGFYLLAKRLFKNRLASLLTVYFIYFGSSFGWIIDYVKTKTFGGESNFWINQPVSFNLNPPFAISMVLMMTALLLVFLLLQQRSKLGLLVLVIVGGCLIEFKVYAGLIFMSSLLVLSIQQLLLLRQIELLKSVIPITLLSSLLFIPQNKGASDLILFQPFWFIHAMVDSPDRLGFSKLSEARMAYMQRGEQVKFLLTEVLAFSIYVIGNLGTRFVAFLLIPFLLTKRILPNLEVSFVLWIIFISFSVPLLFIQKGTPWNTIQFSYYGLYLMSIFAGLGLARFGELAFTSSGVSSQNYGRVRKMVGILIVTVILIVTPISSFATFKAGLGEVPPSRLTFNEMEALAFLRKAAAGVVLTYPYQKEMRSLFEPPFPLVVYETSSYVSAFSHKPTFLEDEIQMEIFQIDYKKRLVESTDFFRGREQQWSKAFLKNNMIRYIYLPKIFKVSLDEASLGIKNVFENSEVYIYEVVE